MGGVNDTRIDTRNSGKVDNGAIARGLPQVGDHENYGPYIRIRIEFDWFCSNGLEDIVNDAIVEIEQVVREEPNEHVGDEMREEHDGLTHLLEPFQCHLTDQNGD